MNRRPYSPDDLAYIRQHAGRQTARQIAQALDRSVDAINKQIREMRKVKTAPLGPRERELHLYEMRRLRAYYRGERQPVMVRVASVWEFARVQGVAA